MKRSKKTLIDLVSHPLYKIMMIIKIKIKIKIKNTIII